MPVERNPFNPIIRPEEVKPSHPDWEVICAFNAGVARLGKEIILLLRVAERPRDQSNEVCRVPVYDSLAGQLTLRSFKRGAAGMDFSDPRVIGTPEGMYLTSMSHLRAARSKDGTHFSIDEQPALFPELDYEAFGIEDPRITQMGSDYYVNYVGVSSLGIVTALARTRDFRSYERLGIIFAPDNKDAAIFPEKINGKYYALHRPSISGFGRPEIWIAESPDLICWGNHRRLAGLRDSGWEGGRIGGSAVPFRTEKGWVEIYHGADQNARYCLGALLLDENEPWKVLGRSRRPILEPSASYERQGFFGNVVFSCGVLCEDGVVNIFYGASDTFTAAAQIPLSEVLDGLE
jgi:beta-1,2-mannobiose phosphorylase / 1,2-beta-oligomannan phosphorylase